MRVLKDACNFVKYEERSVLQNYKMIRILQICIILYVKFLHKKEVLNKRFLSTYI